MIELVTTIKGRRIVSGFTLAPECSLAELASKLAHADRFLQHVADVNGVVHDPRLVTVKVYP